MKLGARDFVRVIGLVLVALCCGLACSEADVSSAVQESSFEVEGAITKVSPGKLTLDSGQGILFRVVLDDKTAIAGQNGEAGSEKDLKVGVKIHVVGDFQDSGEIKAQKIEIKPSAAEPSKQNSSSVFLKPRSATS